MTRLLPPFNFDVTIITVSYRMGAFLWQQLIFLLLRFYKQLVFVFFFFLYLSFSFFLPFFFFISLHSPVAGQIPLKLFLIFQFCAIRIQPLLVNSCILSRIGPWFSSSIIQFHSSNACHAQFHFSDVNENFASEN